MGGVGSGSWYRWDKKTTVEGIRQIDIRYMKKHGLLGLGCSGTLWWTCDGEPNGDIRYTCYHDHLVLKYRYRENGGEWQPVTEIIDFDTTPCNYGGSRRWYLCPDCQRRVAILYGAEKRFLCRHCYGLAYTSQNAGKLDGAIDRLHKLGKRTFEHYEYGEGWGKKKGMHWKTFNHLVARYEALDRLVSVGMEEHMIGIR